MIKPREGQMNYGSLEELAYNYLFIVACLTDEEERKLKIEWGKQGGFKKIPWWEFVMNNTRVGITV
jgi:hypothetical protein